MDTSYIFSDIVKIPPYIGENYQDGLWGKRVLILGNSFYCNESTCIKYNSECWEKKKCQENCEGFRDYCKESISDSSSPFHKKITSMISGKDCFNLTEKEWNLEWENVWSKVAFYNFVTTVIVGGGSDLASIEAYIKSDDAFFEVLDVLKPDIIIALGTSELFKNMPGDSGRYENRYEWRPTKAFKGDIFDCGVYKQKDGDVSRIIWIYHPSSRGKFNYKTLHECIKEFTKET